MTYSEIEITFVDDLAINEQIGFTTTSGSTNTYERWVNLRSAIGQVTQGTATDVVGERSAINFMQSFNLDWNNPVIYELSRVDNVVTIKSKIPNNDFSTFYNYVDGTVFPYALSTNATAVITNFSGTVFEETNTVIEEATSPCSHYKVTITTSALATDIDFVNGNDINSNTDNPFSFERLRGQGYRFTATAADGQTFQKIVSASESPQPLNSGVINIQVNNSPNGATVNVISVIETNTTLEYSIDNSTWQTSNQFTGLSPDTYTLYVRDNLGCNFSETFTVTDTSIRSAYFLMPKSNAIRFANRVTWADCANYKTSENTLSNEEDVKLPHQYVQLFQSCDTPTTQFRSNYTTNKAYVVTGTDSTPEMSNLALYSEEIDNAYWLKDDLTITANEDGVADKLIATSFSSLHIIYKDISKDASVLNYTLSAYVKADEYSRAYIRLTNAAVSGGIAGYFNLNDQTFTELTSLGSWVNVNTSITSEADGFYRISLTVTTDNTNAIQLALGLVDDSGNIGFIGNNSDGMLFKNIQLQEGALTQYIPTTSSISTIAATDGNIEIPITQATNNIGLKDRRDARKYNRENGKTGVYFIDGNTYDYDTNADTGDYVLNGLLPDWAYVGNYFRMDSAWHLIESIETDTTLNAQALVISNEYTGEDVLTNVASIYDLENFEEYEFTIDMSDYLDSCIQVKVVSTDDDFTEVTQLSEKINVKVNQEGTVPIRYKNKSNTDINFSRGLEFTIRVQVEKVSALIFDETENNKTDTTVRLITSEVNEGDSYVLSPLPTEIMRKVVLALSHDTLSISDISYVKNDSIEVEGALEDTNLYDVIANMIKSNSSFNSNLVQGANSVNTDSLEIPGLIETDSGYVSYL